MAMVSSSSAQATWPLKRQDEVTQPVPSFATGAALLVDGKEVFPQLIKDLKAAKSSIDIIQYGFKDGKIGREVASILIEKAKAGIPVRVLVDSHGSGIDHGATKNLFLAMAQGGVQIVDQDTFKLFHKEKLFGSGGGPSGSMTPRKGDTRIHRPLDFEHRKLYVIDNKIAYTGGVGVEDHFVDRMHDVMLRVMGPIAPYLRHAFSLSFAAKGGPSLTDPRLEQVPAVPFPSGKTDPKANVPREVNGPIPMEVLQNIPGSRSKQITDAYCRFIDEAKKNIDLVCPYFGDRTIVRHLCAASKRGVRVRLLLPGHPESKMVARMQHKFYRALLKAGVQIDEWQGLLHAKVMTVDGERMLLGSCNLDGYSLNHGYELNLSTESKKLVKEMNTRFFEPSFEKSPEAHAQGNVVQRVLNWLTATFASKV